MTTMTSLPDGYRAVVAGATGGIGRAFRDLLDADPRCGEVTGLARGSMPALDVTDEESIAACAEAAGRGGEIHLLVDATGLLHDGALQPEKSLEALDGAHLARLFAVNASGPALLLKHFHRLMPRRGRSLFGTLSARVGSIGDNRLGGWYGYRASKAALNMFVRTAAIEIARKRPDHVSLALHPGTVATGLSDPFSSGRDRLAPDDAAARMLGVLDRAEPADSGGFFAYDGSPVVW